MATALITGPTSGIGLGFTELLAAKGFDLVLVARNRERLEALANRLDAEHGVDVEVISADLSIRTDLAMVEARLQSTKKHISVLVNNAGFGINSSFLNSDVEVEQRAVNVLITAVMRLTHAVLPGMVDRRYGVIINISSVASWITSGTYSSAKSWVTVFTESLFREVRGTGVRVIAVCPGFVHTEFHDRAGINMTKVSDWMWLDVSQVVDQTVRDLSRNRPVSVAGVQYKVLSALLRHAPRSAVRLASTVRSSSTLLDSR